MTDQAAALLGLATTRELLDEIRVRGAVEPEYVTLGREMAVSASNMLATLPDAMLEYRTVDGRG